MKKLTVDGLRAVSGELEAAGPAAALRWAVASFGHKAALACSFGAEDMVLVHMLAGLRPGARVFYLDTGLLFGETYHLKDLAEQTYPLHWERVEPRLTLEEQAREHGPELWARAPDLCCHIRKVEPLEGILKNLDAWITGIRRDQTPERAGASVVEWDARFGLVKINPLAPWTSEQVMNYLREHEVPYNPLHDQGYPSIGCVPCTHPVEPGADPRSGRWQGRGKRECGLHGTDDGAGAGE